jgi:hypothetical protein
MLLVLAAAVLLQFQTPSGHVRCAYAPAPMSFLRCDAREPYTPAPGAPSSCRAQGLEWRDAFWVRRTGRAAPYCHGDTAFAARPAPVLVAGRTWSQGGITCRSQGGGLVCRNRDGHGFSLGRTRWRIF